VRWCDTVIMTCLGATLFYLSMSIAIIEVTAVMMFVVWLFKRLYVYTTAEKKPTILKALAPVPTILNKPMWAMAAVILTGAFFSLDPAMSFTKLLSKYAQLMFTFFIFVETFDRPARLWGAVYCLLASLIPVIMDGVFQHIRGTSMIFHYTVATGRLTSTFSHPNDLGTYLAAIFPVLVSLRNIALPNLLGKKIMRFLIFILSLGTLFILAMTYSRAAWLALFLSLILLGMKGKNIARGIFCALIFVFCFILFLPQAERTRSDITPVHHQNYGSFLSISSRLPYWSSALQVIEKYPLLGSGYNTYVLALEKFKLTPYEYAHNGYLQIAAETGLIGLGVFIWLIVNLFFGLNNISSLTADPALGKLLFGVSIGIFAFLTNSFFDTGFSSIQLSTMLWLLFGFSAAIRRIGLTVQTSQG